MLFENIKISRIDHEDNLFFLDPPDDTPLQWDSRQPLYNPVWLQQKGPLVYRIVDGFRVVNRARLTPDCHSIPATVFPEDSSLPRLWKQRAQKRELEGNLPTISYLKGLTRFMDAEGLTVYPGDEEDGFLPADVGRQVIERDYLTRLLEKSQLYEAFTNIQQLGFKQIDRLHKLSDVTLNRLGRLLEGMHVKGKKLTSLLDLIDELDRGFNIQLNDLLEDKELSTELKEVPAHQRYRHIKSRLLTLRYPQLNQQLSAWNESMAQTGLGNIVEIRHDPYFEEDFLQFIFSPGNVDELRQQLKIVLDKAESPAMGSLFNFI